MTTTRGTSTPGASSSQSGRTAKLDHYRDRIRDLGDVLGYVTADRELAMFRAHQHGMSVEEIAALAEADPARVAEVLAVLAREADIDDWSDGPEWTRVYWNPW